MKHMVSDRDGSVEGSPGSGRRVVLAEDDDALRALLAHALRDRGYLVEEASSGREAAAFTRECPDALLSDLIMPGLNGQDLAYLCVARCPDMVLIFMSGYAPHELNAMDVAQMVYMAKPVSPTEIADTLDRLLAQQPPKGETGAAAHGDAF
jgi:DNA-binding NtrC family response regulator